MELVIPGFAARFDIDDLIRCIAPRKLFVVSSSEDPFAADAEEAVDRARSAFEAAGALEHLRHLRVDGAHDLDAERFSAIVEWLEAA
jgi:flavin-binding protein dodecin